MVRYMVYAWELEGLLCHDFGSCVSISVVPGPIGFKRSGLCRALSEVPCDLVASCEENTMKNPKNWEDRPLKALYNGTIAEFGFSTSNFVLAL